MQKEAQSAPDSPPPHVMSEAKRNFLLLPNVGSKGFLQRENNLYQQRNLKCKYMQFVLALTNAVLQMRPWFNVE